MTSPRSLAIASLAIGAVLAVACGPKRVAQPSRPGDELIVLLPDSDGTTGRARVTSPSGVVTLDAAREATRVSGSQPPSLPSPLSPGEVSRLFAEALSALPPEPRHFILNFRFESNELTEESRALMPEIVKTVKARSVHDVVVIGHTDTAGPAPRNIDLGLLRAAAVRNLLVESGLARTSIAVTSHGEVDLLIPTADEIPEPRNRRVEITVR